MIEDPCDFVLHEAALIDASQWDDWLALFDATAHYWVPLLGADQTDPHSHNSIAYEDYLLLQLRIQRLQNPRAHSLHPRVYCQHVLQRPRVVSPTASAHETLVQTPFIYIERQGEEQILLTGTYVHRLLQTATGWMILQKRVNLLDAGQPLPAIQLFI